MDISILLTTYNREQDCIKCLNTLLPQITSNIELFLLDDWHIESKNLKQYCNENNFNYVHTGIQKQGKVHWRVPGFALNIGAKMSKGFYLIIGNAEIYHYNNDCIQKMYNTKTASAPIVYDEQEKGNTLLNNKLPFCFGLPRSTYFEIGGYDEDFMGYCFDDNDFSERVLTLIPFKQVDAEVLHLWNVRGANNRGDPRINTETWNYNKNLYENRKNILVRNQNKEWGIL